MVKRKSSHRAKFSKAAKKCSKLSKKKKMKYQSCMKKELKK